MTSAPAEHLKLTVEDSRSVSALWQLPARARAVFVLAHGAGAGMTHPFMSAIAADLAERCVGTLRYQFPYMEKRGRRPDPPALCHATVRAAAAEAHRREPELPLIAGGRSFGGRMTSQAQASAPLAGVRGLAFLAFPLHPAGKPATERADHLRSVQIPMLFVQGTHDDLAGLELLEPMVAGLGGLATLKLLQDADHSWRVPARTGRKDAQVRAEAIDAMVAWMEANVGLPA